MTKDKVVNTFNEEKEKGFSELKEAIKNTEKIELSEVKQFEFNGNSKTLSQSGNILNGYRFPLITDEKMLPKNGSYIYLFFTEDIESLKKNFEKIKKSHDGLPRFNKKNYEEKSHCVYVGSSENFSERIKEHLGEDHGDTYAIRFSRWLPPLDIKITCYYFNANVKDGVLKILENRMWKQFKPILGQSGLR